jgi:two-component system invasion response regulator UvrY
MKTAIYNIAIADDNPMFRYLLKKSIGEMNDFHITIEACNGKDLIDKLEAAYRLPQICILDIGMPVMDGYKAIEIIMKKWPSVRVLAFSQFYHDYAIGTMINAGARGFISKQEDILSLESALISIKENGYYYSRHATREMFEGVKKGSTVLPVFTSVERSLLSLFCKDMQYSEIASKLFISTHTIEKHKQNISRKLGIHSREGLMLFAIQNDLISSNTAAL